MLYPPWYNEDIDVIGTFEEHFLDVQSVVLANARKYTQSDIEDIDTNENAPPEHVWDQIAPSTEASRAQCATSSLHVRYKGPASRGEIPPEEYRRLLRGLNTKQRQIVMFHRNWCKKAVIALKQGKPIEPYRICQWPWRCWKDPRY